VSRLKLENWMQQLLWESHLENVIEPLNFPELLRVKGLVYLDGSEKKHVVQSVQELYDIQTGADWNDEKRLNKMVFIGRNLDQGLLQESFTKSVIIN
jgi:G3E family GTPase